MKKLNFMSVAGGVVGGAVAKVVQGFTKSDDLKDGETDYVTIAVQAVAGAAISAFSANDILKGVGSGMIGVAGYNLASGLGIGEEKTTATSGLGSVLSENSIGRIPFRYRRTSKSIDGVETQNGSSNIQQSSTIL